jgi:hypothetical protein
VGLSQANPGPGDPSRCDFEDHVKPMTPHVATVPWLDELAVESEAPEVMIRSLDAIAAGDWTPGGP